MIIDVTLRVSGIDLEDDTTGNVLGEQFPDMLWQGEGKHLTMSFPVSESNAPAEVLERVRALQAKLPLFRAIRADRDLVSTTEIGLRVGVSREAARKWSKQADFPAPFSEPGNTKVWLWCEVASWLQSSRAIDMEDNSPSEAMLTQIDNCLMGNPDATSIQWQNVGMAKKEFPAEFRERLVINRWVRSSTAVRVEEDCHSDYLLARAS